MRKAEKSKSTLFIAMFVFAMVLCFCPSKKVAASQSVGLPKKSGEAICCMIVDKNSEYGLFKADLWRLPHGKGMRIVNFKSSNQKVIKTWIAKDEDGDSETGGWPRLKLKKPGNAKVTLVYKTSGKKYKFSMNIQVIKYQNPLKVFKIGNKDYAYVYNKVNARGAAVDENGTKMPSLKAGTYKFKVQTRKNFSLVKNKIYYDGKGINIKKAKKIKVQTTEYNPFGFQAKYKNKVISNLYFQ